MSHAGGTVTKNPPANTGDMDSIPGPGLNPQATIPETYGPLAPVSHNFSTPHAATAEAHVHRACARSKRSHSQDRLLRCNWKKPAHSSEEPVRPKTNN